MVPGPALDRARRGPPLARRRRGGRGSSTPAAAAARCSPSSRGSGARSGSSPRRRAASGRSPAAPARSSTATSRGCRSPTTSSTSRRRSTCSSTSTTTAARSPSCAGSCARAARWWSPCRPTRGCGAATTSSTTTGAATRAARCAPRRSAAGWEVARLTHFNSLLLPAAAIARRFDRGDGLEIPPAPVNRALELPLRLERPGDRRRGLVPVRPLAARRAALAGGYSVSPAASSASSGSR